MKIDMVMKKYENSDDILMKAIYKLLFLTHIVGGGGATTTTTGY